MSLASRISVMLRSNPTLRATVYRPLVFVANSTFRRGQALQNKAVWEQRHREVEGCPDNDRIPRVPEAGQVVGNVQTMHNGIKIQRGSYYGGEVTHMLTRNRGVHEPQEEWVFQEVLKHIRDDAAMLELGAYWGFYSMWFLNGKPRRHAVLVEPEAENMEMGQANFKLNNLKGDFVRAFVGAAPGKDEYGRRTVCVDELVKEYKIDHLDILHCDIQGWEVQMLDGARETLAAKKVDYVFISTHSQELHETCRNRLKEAGFEIIADADMQDTYSYDGLLAARRKDLAGLGPVAISLKRTTGIRPAKA